MTTTNLAGRPRAERLPIAGWREWFTSLAFPMRLLVTAIVAVNLILVVITIVGFFVSDAGYDWLIYREAGRRVVEGGLYNWEGTYAWSYSPLLAYAFAALAPIGYLGWSLLHVAVLAALRGTWLVILTLLLWPFWADVYNGNTMVFVFVAAVGALRRNPVAITAYLLLCLLMPRPVMLPLLAWILWQLPVWRLRFVGLIAVNIVAVLATGYGPAWVDALIHLSAAPAIGERDVGPAVLLGSWWLPLGALLAVLLALRGRMGWASVAASPYWLPQYLLMLVLEGVTARDRSARH